MSGTGKESRWKGYCGPAQLQGGRRGLVFLIHCGRFHPLCCFCICGRLASCISQAVPCAKATGCIFLKIIKTAFNPRPDTLVEAGI